MKRPVVKLRGLTRIANDLRAVGVRRFAIEIDFDEAEEGKRRIGFASDVSEATGGFGIETEDEGDDE